jgi:hypothetical protein
MQTAKPPPTRHAAGRPFFWGRAAAAAVVLSAIAALLLAGAVDCGFARLTGLPCPGCGSTRAARALLSLDVPTALRMNPVAPFMVIVLGVLAARGVWLVGRDGNANELGQGRLGTWLLRGLAWSLGAQIVVWALRFVGLFGGTVPV